MPYEIPMRAVFLSFFANYPRTQSYGMSLFSPRAYMSDIVVCASGAESLIKDTI